GWGRKLGFGELLGTSVSGETIGIVGMGRIGRAVARRARGFGMQVLYHDVKRLPTDHEQGAVCYEHLDDMLPRCAFLSLHAPAGDKPLIDERSLRLLPEGAVLVNAGRGSLVDEDALVDALVDGRLAAAGLDTYNNEPNPNARL